MECVLCVDRGVLELSSCVHFCDIDDVHSNQSILTMKWWWTPLDENAFRAKSIPSSILWPGRRRCRQETSNYICSWLSNKVGELKVYIKSVQTVTLKQHGCELGYERYSLHQYFKLQSV